MDANQLPEAQQREMIASRESMHGRLGLEDWAAPLCVTEFDVNARLSFTDIKAHEYMDREEVLIAKVAVLAGLVRRSRSCLAFTGAGISTASGIDDYATKAKDASVTAPGRPSVSDWKLARPTKAHRVMVAMYEAGFLKHWVQQNHDSLPQKAGFPQHALNEIHGSLHDPGNPIVPYEGFLRDDLHRWMAEWEQTNDLCLSLGTSLSGFNVDSMAETASTRHIAGTSQGLVIVNLQQTPYDAGSSLRIFARLDTVLELLAVELGIVADVKPMDHAHWPSLPDGALIEEDILSVPFDAESGEPSASGTLWDLRLGKRVRLTGGPYEGDVGTVVEKSAEGHYRIRFVDSINPQLQMKRRPFSLWLGNWWLEQAARGYGIVPGGRIPFVNAPDEEEPVAAPMPEPLVVHEGPRPRPVLSSKPPPPPPPRRSQQAQMPAGGL